jgi:nucleotide-binding universal stress UspA family protein
MSRESPLRLLPTDLVVGFDGSAASRSAAGAATALAERSGSRVHLVTVIHVSDSGRGGEARARRELRDYTKSLRASQRRLLSEELRVGDAPTEIVRLAAELNARLIVVGTSHRTGLAKLLLGSTVEGLLRHATCPLLVVSADPDAWPPAQVVVGDDATAEAHLAGDLACEIGALYGAELTLLEAMTLDGPVATGANWMGPVRDLFEDRLKDRADDLEAAYGSRPSVRLADGTPASVLVDVVGGDHGRRTLVALGTGRRASLARVLHPSVALAVAGAATGSVLISPVGVPRVDSPRRQHATIER